MIRRPSGVVVKSVLGGEWVITAGRATRTLGRTIFQRFHEHNSGSIQEQIRLYACPENPTGAWPVVKLSLGRGCGSDAQDYRETFRNIHPGIPEPGEKGFIARYHVRYGLNEKYGRPIICERVNEPRRAGEVDTLDSSWVV